MTNNKQTEYNRTYVSKNRDKVRAYQRDYRKAHPDKVAAWRRNYARKLLDNEAQTLKVNEVQNTEGLYR